MYLVGGLITLAFFKKLSLMILFIGLLSIRLFYLKQFNKILIWLIVSLFFIFHYHFELPIVGTYYKVVNIHESQISLRRGWHLFDYNGKQDLNLGDRLIVTQYEPYNTKTLYQRINHIKGKIYDEDIILIKSSFSLRHYFWTKKSQNETIVNFLNHKSDSLISVLSLQCLGFLEIVKFFLSYFKDKAFLRKIEFIIPIFYGYLFGFSYGVIRILVNILFKNKSKEIVTMMLLYPHSLFYPGFYLVYSPVIFELFFQKRNDIIIRTLLILRTFGRIHVLEMIFYPLIKIVSGIVLILLFLGLDQLALFILEFKLSSRFLLVGAPPLWILGIVFLNKKTQIWVLVSLLLILTYYPFTRVSMINVYQGDAFLITLPFNSTSILIDTGRKYAYSNIKKQMYRLGVKTLDYLVISHDDLDHSENKNDLIRDFNVQVIVEDKESSLPFFTSLLNDVNYEDENENSLIYYFEASNTRILFMGDATINQELTLIARYPHLRVEVLKLGHHGSKTSTHQDFLAHIKPKVALISSNPKIYNHPHPEVLKRLYEFNITPVQTSEHGSVTLIITPIINFWVSEAQGFGIMK